MAEWRDMTEAERAACLAVSPGRVSYPVASAPKRLARSLSHQAQYRGQITDKQAACLWRLVSRFRRQLPKAIVESIPASMTYDLVEGRRVLESKKPVLWWCPSASDPNRVKVLSVLPPPPIDPNQPVGWRNFAFTHEPAGT